MGGRGSFVTVLLGCMLTPCVAAAQPLGPNTQDIIEQYQFKPAVPLPNLMVAPPSQPSEIKKKPAKRRVKKKPGKTCDGRAGCAARDVAPR